MCFFFEKTKTFLWNYRLEQMTHLAPDAKILNSLLYVPRGTFSAENEHRHKLDRPNDLEQIRTLKHNYTFLTLINHLPFEQMFSKPTEKINLNLFFVCYLLGRYMQLFLLFACKRVLVHIIEIIIVSPIYYLFQNN